MPITNNKAWEKLMKQSADLYGKAMIRVAREAMRLLDTEVFPPPLDKGSAHKLITLAAGERGMPRFMAKDVATIVGHCHSRGEEFTKAWHARRLNTCLVERKATARDPRNEADELRKEVARLKKCLDAIRWTCQGRAVRMADAALSHTGE